MRQVKFRGLRVDGHGTGWTYGSLVEINGLALICSMDDAIYHDALHPLSEEFGMYEIVEDLSRVNPDSVGQFTGLLDKTGAEIYEGDIIKGDYAHEHTIGFSDGRFTATGVHGNESGIYQSWLSEFSKKIIGNIHEQEGDK